VFVLLIDLYTGQQGKCRNCFCKSFETADAWWIAKKQGDKTFAGIFCQTSSGQFAIIAKQNEQKKEATVILPENPIITLV